MAYFQYHAAAKKLIREGKLKGWYYTQEHNRISPALVLVFDDVTHPVMPVREYRWAEYLSLLPEEKQIQINKNDEKTREDPPLFYGKH